ncbi:MAG: family 10 glycosylhydrolase [Planctomycetota bacterium]|nr:family 10 glycosylhydrolase [Planctomycetota bacterium]
MLSLSRPSVMAFLACAAWLVSFACGAGTEGWRSAPAPASLPAPPRELRGVWVASVDNIDWPSRPGLRADEQRAEAERLLDVLAGLNLNAVFLQVRPTSDTLYPSELEPWSAFLSGRSGAGPQPAYDPLAFWIEAARARAIDVHAWINPYRARHPQSIGDDAPAHVSKARPELVREYGPYLWLDPGEPEAETYILRVVDDLLRRYPLDGLHIDDYFYPYPRQDPKTKSDVPFPDDASYSAHANGAPRDQWRRDNVDRLVQKLQRATRDAARAAGRTARFTVSPFGIWRPENPPGIKGMDAVAKLHADSRRWLRERWADAIVPQLYWPIEQRDQSYPKLLEWWAGERSAASSNSPTPELWIGLNASRVGPPRDASDRARRWPPEEIVQQIEIARRAPGVGGHVLFSARVLAQNGNGLADVLRERVYREATLPPEFVPPKDAGQATAEARSSELPAPNVRVSSAGEGDPANRTLIVEWNLPGAEASNVRRWVAWLRTDSGWSTRVLPGSERSLALAASDETKLRAVFIAAVDDAARVHRAGGVAR